MVDGKRSQEVEGAYKKDSEIHFYSGTIVIGEDQKLSGTVRIDHSDEKKANLEGRLERINNRNYLIFEIDLRNTKQFHILRQADLSPDIIGRYSGTRYGISKMDSTTFSNITLNQIDYNNIPEELKEKRRGGSIFYLGISENKYFCDRYKEKIKKFFGIKSQ